MYTICSRYARFRYTFCNLHSNVIARIMILVYRSFSASGPGLLLALGDRKGHVPYLYIAGVSRRTNKNYLVRRSLPAGRPRAAAHCCRPGGVGGGGGGCGGMYNVLLVLLIVRLSVKCHASYKVLYGCSHLAGGPQAAAHSWRRVQAR
jgi:hypothetical protein